MLIDSRWNSGILDVRSFKGADCDTGHYLVIANVRERLAVSKQETQKFDAERFNLRKLHELDGGKNIRFTTLENLNDSEDIHRAWENIKEKLKRVQFCTK
jgi:hypothetical protein